MLILRLIFNKRVITLDDIFSESQTKKRQSLKIAHILMFTLYLLRLKIKIGK